MALPAFRQAERSASHCLRHFSSIVCGNNKSRSLLAFAEARALARKIGVSSSVQWKIVRKDRPPGLPSNPETFYPQFTTFSDFFGFECHPKWKSQGIKFPLTAKREVELAGKKFVEEVLRKNACNFATCFSPFPSSSATLLLGRRRQGDPLDIVSGSWLLVQVKTAAKERILVTNVAYHPSIATIIACPVRRRLSFVPPLYAGEKGTIEVQDFDHDEESVPAEAILNDWFEKVTPLSFSSFAREAGLVERERLRADILLELAASVFRPATFPVRFSTHASSFWSLSVGSWRCAYRVVTRNVKGRFQVNLMKFRQGFNVPLEEDDPVDHFLIVVAEGTYALGLYLIPKRELCQRGIVTSRWGAGRVTMEVQPPFAEIKSAKGKALQEWQLPYYVSLEGDPESAAAKTRRLLQKGME